MAGMPGLGEAGGPPAVGVDDASQGRKGLVKGQVGVGVAGGLPLPFHPRTGCKVYHHHIVGSHTAVLHPGGLDDHKAPLPIHPGDVPPGEGHQAVLRQEEIGLQHLLLQLP